MNRLNFKIQNLTKHNTDGKVNYLFPLKRDSMSSDSIAWSPRLPSYFAFGFVWQGRQP